VKKFIAVIMALTAMVSAVPAALAAGEDVAGAERRIEDMAERFDDLSDAQKRKIYNLDRRASENLAQLARLYGQYGLMEQDAANKIAELITERSQLSRLQGDLPGITS